MNTLHFISGLPRSGTTLLSAILNQNPRFSASISGPAARMARAIITEAQAQGGYRTQCPKEKRKKLILNLMNTYYEDSKPVVFDTNRGWPLLMPMISDLYQKSKVICCIREIPWVVDSFERLLASQPYALSNLFRDNEGANVYSRANALLLPDRTVGFALSAIKEAAYGGHGDRVLFVQYEDLCRNPEHILRSIYEFIGEDYYAHDFDSVESSHDEFDADVGIAGMHATRRKVEFVPRQTILPPDLWQALEPLSFWNRGV